MLQISGDQKVVTLPFGVPIKTYVADDDRALLKSVGEMQSICAGP
jgi:hypothetical protein